MRPKTSFPSLSSIEPSLSSASLSRTWTDSIQRVHIYHTHYLFGEREFVPVWELLISMTYREWNHHGISIDWALIFSIIEIHKFVFIKFLIFPLLLLVLLYFLYSSIFFLKCKWIADMWRKIERFQILIILVENFMHNYPSKIYLPQESIFKSKLLYSLYII